MGCSSSQPVGDDDAQQAAPQLPLQGAAAASAPTTTGSAATDPKDQGPFLSSVVPGSHEARTVLGAESTSSPKSAAYTTLNKHSPPEETDATQSHARRLMVKPAGGHSRNQSLNNEAPKPSSEGFVRKRSNSVSIVTREREGSRVMRVAEDEETPVAAAGREVASGPIAATGTGASGPPVKSASPVSSVHRRSMSVSVANLDRGAARLSVGADGLDPESPLPGMVRSGSPASHLGLSSPPARSSKRTGEVPLAQKILQKQAVAAAREALQASEGTAPGSPVSNHSLRRPSISKHEGSPRLQVRARSNSVSLDPFVVNQPNNPITAHNVQNLFDRVSTPPSMKREGSFGGGAVSPRGSAPRPDLLRPASALRDKWAARTEELWTHYAGRGATHMPKKALMQLSEDLFAEFVSKYKAKLRAEFTKAHPQKEYSEAQCDKDLRNDLPFLLPAKASSSDKPEPDDYVYYIYRFTTREMRRFAAAAPGGTVSAVDNGVGSIKASPSLGSTKGPGHERRPSISERRPSIAGGRPNMFNLDAPAGPVHSPSGGGLSSERPASSKLTKAEFTLGWGHCHDMLFKCMEPERERPGTPCKLM